ncbi:MAG: pirin family protein [Polyangiaceae bacterium]
MKNSGVLDTAPLGFPWATVDPFLFCVHHVDDYPMGNEKMGPVGSLAGRDLGMDFTVRDGFRMYHGRVVPGFPQHPHRGFETVTLVRRGYIDHSDSLGAAARFGAGDVQWLTAGRGVVHSEMFPLRDRERRNPVELFQIWLNLPAADKMADPHFSMLWSGRIPRVVTRDDAGRSVEIVVAAGSLEGRTAPPPPPRSWASRADSDVAIWTIRMDPGARFTLPPTHATSVRTLYFFSGTELSVDAQSIPVNHAAVVVPDRAIELQAGNSAVELLMLQGRPIGEPIAQQGPFVMNTRAEIAKAYSDYQRTRFGGWPWPSDDPVHPREEGVFARHADGRIERPDDAG